MAASKIIMQSADGASVGLTIPDGLTSGERTIALGANLSGVTAYHLLNGEVSVSNGIITSGFSTTLFSRTAAGSFVVNSGIDMDTQWGNTAEEKFGGLVWVKDRVTAGAGHALFDTIRGAEYYIQTNTTGINTYLASTLVSFNNNGFTYGDTAVLNASIASWNFQTTHRRTGTTNHGKAFTEHYNPFTGFTMIKYEGSGLAGHEIPHSLGRKLGFCTIKNLTTAGYNWLSIKDGNTFGYLNTTNAFASMSWNGGNNLFTDNSFIASYENAQYTDQNASGNTYILYGWANSYFDESNKLIGNYEIGVYQGTGAAGNKVKTKGKPAWVMTKRLDAVSNWLVLDGQRSSFDGVLVGNSVEAESLVDVIDITTDGFINKLVDANWNVAGGQYLYMVVYDNDNGSGKSKYPKATDSSQLQINALIPFANGVDGNGAKNTILSKNETITGLTLTQGKNYVYSKNDGTYGVKPHRPRYLSNDLVRTYAGESPDYYNVVSNKWYSCDAGAELVTNGTFTTNTSGWTACEILGGGIGTISSVNSTLQLTNNGSNGTYTGAYQILTGLTVGKEYVVKSSGVATAGIIISTNTLYTSRQVGAHAGTQFTFIAQASSVYLIAYNNTEAANASVNVDNISVFQTDITPTSEITDSRNYLDAIVYADHNGQVEYVEQLPKTQYVDEMKANEFKGKNTCTAWVNFDGTTTPPTIRDSYNVSAVIRTGSGAFKVYFENTMDNLNYTFVVGGADTVIREYFVRSTSSSISKEYIIVECNDITFASGVNPSTMTVHIYGGRN